MSNLCNNHIAINTSVDPGNFLELNHEWRIAFFLNDSLVPFENPGAPGVNLHWTDHFYCDLVSIENPVTTKAPPEPEPIIITQGTRRYPVKQKPDFVPRTSRNITIKGVSTWTPPLGYLDWLYKILLAKDDQVSMDCWFFEPGQELSWHWHNGMVTYDEYPATYTLPGPAIILDSGEMPQSWWYFSDKYSFEEVQNIIHKIMD